MIYIHVGRISVSKRRTNFRCGRCAIVMANQVCTPSSQREPGNCSSPDTRSRVHRLHVPVESREIMFRKMIVSTTWFGPRLQNVHVPSHPRLAETCSSSGAAVTGVSLSHYTTKMAENMWTQQSFYARSHHPPSLALSRSKSPMKPQSPTIPLFLV